uniref:ATP synthase complex subunit 8 n=1 Tax=Planusocoris schaeferi TaxID=2924051 RepID=A0A8T9EKL3_9HEMI|nr:ATP synthase F0 subunit 8 [Planusocoris schaeferi]UNA71164.1 ATP synthase F0 subunit 8 [Planusocoris schaeferi]
MPQMAPLWWEVLFMLFMLSFFMMNIIMFFNLKMKNKNKLMKLIMVNQFKWKW